MTQSSHALSPFFMTTICAAALSALSASPAGAEPGKTLESTPLTDLPALPASTAQVHTLPNGLTVIIDADRSAPVASVQAWVATGSIHEGDWLGAGLSHILEHMLFKGTETRGAGDIARAIQDQGGYINAYTSFDRTVYWIDVPSTGVSEAIDILADAMMNSTLPEDEYIKEQEVIRREFAMGFDDPGRQGIQLLLRTLYQHSPYGIPIIGHLDVYNKLTRDDVMQYYRERYAPQNITFIIAGDVDEKAVLGQLEEFFAEIPRGRLAPVLVPQEPPQIGRREAHEEFPTELSRLFLAWRVPGLDDSDAAALELLGSILGSGRSSILNQEIRERQNLAHSIGAGVYSTEKEGVFYISALCDPAKREAVEKETVAAIAAVQERGVRPEDLEKARRGMLSDLLGSLQTARGRASSHGSNWQLTRNLDFGRDFLQAVNEVTVGDIQRVAQEYLRPGQITVTSLNPEGSLQTEREAVAATEAPPIQRFTLPNGLRLLVREDPRLPLVAMTAAFRGGVLAETPENNGITRLLAQTLLKGTKTRSAEQLAAEIEGVGGSIGSDAGNNTFAVSVEVMRPDLGLGLEILADVLLHPSFPEREVQIERQSQLAAIKAEEDQITAQARNLLRERLFGDHPYSLRATGSAAAVAELQREDLEKFHREFVTAQNGVLAVFGDVKAEEVRAQVEKLFGSLPSGELALTSPPEAPAPAELIVAEREVDKQQAVVMVGYRGGSVVSPDRPALEIISSASSDLGSRFFDRIREQMGLAYFVGASQMTGLVPGLFVFYVGTDPLKVDKVTEALQEEINTLAAEGLTDEEIERAKRKLLGAEAIRNQSNSSFASNAAINELVGLGYDHHLRRSEEIQNVTAEQVREVARRYFQENSPVRVTVRPPAAPETAATSSSPETL
jgi:zinc protease